MFTESTAGSVGDRAGVVHDLRSGRRRQAGGSIGPGIQLLRNAKRNEAQIGRVWSRAPARSSSSVPSLTISDHTPKWRFERRCWAATSGTWPMPNWTVPPSSWHSEPPARRCQRTLRPVDRESGMGGAQSPQREVDVGHVDSSIRSGVGHVPVHLSDDQPAPLSHTLDRGGKDVDLDAPKDTFPFRGGDVWMRATSGCHSVSNRRGTSDSRIGMWTRLGDRAVPPARRTAFEEMTKPSRHGHTPCGLRTNVRQMGRDASARRTSSQGVAKSPGHDDERVLSTQGGQAVGDDRCSDGLHSRAHPTVSGTFTIRSQWAKLGTVH